MIDPRFRSDFDVTLVDHMGNDMRVCQAARVSTLGAESYDSGESAGLINFLAKNRHGSTFEHCIMSWLISAPIFVWREFMRHRIASYNEESGRYKQLEPVFYLPHEHRPLRQVGKAGAYTFEPGTPEQYQVVKMKFTLGALQQYRDYEEMLSYGIAKEVARMELPLNIYSSAYVTMNLRALMNFLSLRVRSEDSMFASFPQYEIDLVARELEQDFQHVFPLVHSAFVAGGRVQP